jgi:Holliday junction resolvasome RuvABC endonuclease subunit
MPEGADAQAKVLRAMKSQERPKQRILGLDLGLATTGWAVLGGDPGKEPRVKEWGASEYLGAKLEKGEQNPTAYRLARWMAEIEGLIRRHRPTSAAIEDYILGMKNPRTTTSIAELGGVVRMTLWANAIPFRVWGPSAWKKEIWGPGSGNIKKEEVKRRMEEVGIVHATVDALEAYCVAQAEWKAKGEGR